jgi:hypothetical protein
VANEKKKSAKCKIGSLFTLRVLAQGALFRQYIGAVDFSAFRLFRLSRCSSFPVALAGRSFQLFSTKRKMKHCMVRNDITLIAAVGYSYLTFAILLNLPLYSSYSPFNSPVTRQ